MHTLTRFVSAFFTALKMTLRGQTVASRKHPKLARWINETHKHLKDLYQTAEEEGLGQAQREAFTLQIDSRPISMETILAAVQHNLTEEYPRLLRLDDPHSLTVIYASNMNDQHRVTQLAQYPGLAGTPTAEKIAALNEKLMTIPSNQEA